MKDRITWKEIKVNFPSESSRYKDKFLQMFNQLKRDWMTYDELLKFMEEEEGKGEYSVTYDVWEGPQRFREVPQLVMQLNKSIDELFTDDVMKQLMNAVAEMSKRSGHPVTKNTVGWLRVDFIDEEKLLIDEIQSDIMIVLGKMLSGDLEEQRKVLKEQFDLTDEQLTNLLKEGMNKIKQWYKYAVSTLLKIARQYGIKKVLLHTEKSMSMKPGATYPSLYRNVAKDLGFKESVVEINGREIPVFERVAYLNVDFDLVYELVDLAESLLELE